MILYLLLCVHIFMCVNLCILCIDKRQKAKAVDSSLYVSVGPKVARPVPMQMLNDFQCVNW